jgi:hypothetical protein
MALDPSISLQAGKIPQAQGMLGGVERGMKLQQLAMQPAILEQQLSTARQAELTARQAELASKASTAITEAQLPGVQAQAAGLVRGEQLAAAKVKSAQNAFDYDTDGNIILDPNTKQPKFNAAKYQHGLYSSGNFDEALKAGADILKQSKDAYDFLSNARTQAALAAQAAHDNTPGTPAQKAKAAEAMWRDMTGRAVASAGEIGFAISPEQFKYTPGLEKALYTAAINPQAQETLKQGLAAQDIQRDQLGLQVEQFNNSKLTNFTDDASMDPNSPVSIMSRQIARDAGMKIDDNMSAGDIHRNDLTKGVLTSVGAAAGVAKKDASARVNQLAGLSAAIEEAKDVLAANKLTPLNLLQNKFNLKLLDDPKLAKLYGQIQQLPDKSVINEGMDYKALKAVVDGLASNAKANETSAVGGNPAKPEAPKPNTANVTKIKSNEEYRALPSGTVFTGPDGVRRTKP